jgi:PPOX class probable F420-dependent enzyme
VTIPEQIAHSHYVSLTTFRKDGTAVATPVWHAVNGDELFIVSEADAWKVKRIRNNRRVVVTVCSIRGTVKPGAASAEGTARLLDDADTQAGRKLIARKYVTARAGYWFVKVFRLSRPPVVGIAVTF